MEIFFPFIFTLLFSVVFTKMIIALGPSLHWLLRHPDEERWHHTVVPSMGGVAIFLSFSISYFVFHFLHSEASVSSSSDQVRNLWWGGLFIFGLGLLDDLRPLPPYVKLIGQLVIVSLMVMVGIHVNVTGNPLVYIPVTLLWFVGITNAFNLMDNMDGLAGGIALIATCALGFLNLGSGAILPPSVIVLFGAAILGFLFFNIHPAKLFMGDCGSQWLGFFLAGFTIIDTWKSASDLFLVVVTPVLILGVPIFDTALVTLNRKIHGISVSQGGKDHSSHRLVALGLSERKTVFVLWGLAVLFGLIALFTHAYEIRTWVILVGCALTFLVVLGTLLTDVKIYSHPGSESDIPNRAPYFTLLYKRRIVEILLDTVLIGGAYFLAYLVRYDWVLDSFQQKILFKSLPLILATKLLLFLIFGLYRGIWRYIDFEGLSALMRTSLIASLGAVLAVLGMYRFEGFSRTLFFIDFCILFLLMGGSRSLLRGLRESIFAFPKEGLRILIFGAGEASTLLLKEIRKRRDWNLNPVALVDDDVQKVGKSVLGVPVLGTSERLQEITHKERVDHIIIAIPSLTGNRRSLVEERCRKSGVPFIQMPSIEESIISKIARS